MIPKTIHYCWFGRNPLPDSAKECIASWKKYFPEYEIIEWNEDNFDVDIIPYTTEAYKAKKYAFVSDYARFLILYKYGGLYFDTDVEVIKPMDDIVSKGAFMGCELSPDRKGGVMPLIAPGLGLGVEPGNEIYKTIIDSYKKMHLFNMKGLITETVVGIVTRILKSEKEYLNLNNICTIKDITIYPSEYFCPIIAYTGEINITQNTRSIHHYTATWLNKNKVTKFQAVKIRLSYIYYRIYSTIYHSFKK